MGLILDVRAIDVVRMERIIEELRPATLALITARLAAPGDREPHAALFKMPRFQELKRVVSWSLI